MIHESLAELRQELRGAVGIRADTVEVLDEERARRLVDSLVRNAVFGTPEVREFSRWLIWELGQALEVRPASIHDFYMARAQDAWQDRTVPAMNIRFTTYDTARAALRAARQAQVGAFIFEIARSEMGYTDQEPAEYSACLIAAAIREGYRGPLFIQGDHFQVKAAKYRQDPEGAVQEVKELIAKAIPAGFWNIDIDSSTLVDLDRANLDEQQRDNYEVSAHLTRYVRELEPPGVTISLGGEIGEVGEKNSTPEELDAYMEGYTRALGQLGDYTGLSKISVQTGTAHGGILLPDGTLAQVAVDFETLQVLGDRARHWGMGGAVQHGASTLPQEMFHKFPEVQTLEIHLATGFMNTFLDHPAFPSDLLEAMYRHIETHHADERKPNQTEIVFRLKTRKKALGPFKAELWALPPEAREPIYEALEQQFAFFYSQLNVEHTRELVERFVTPPEFHRPMPEAGRAVADDLGLAD